MVEPETALWRVEVFVRGETTWHTNAMEYASRGEAEEAAEDLASRWMLVAAWRVVPTTHPKREPYVAGADPTAHVV